MSSRKEVAILMGGASSEREISLVSGRCVMEAIDTDRFHAVAVDVASTEKVVTAAESLASASGAVMAANRSGAPRSLSGIGLDLSCDIAFIALHGRYGEDGTIQGALELLGVPYTGSGVLASALAMDKIAAKRIFASCGIPTPAWIGIDARQFKSGVIPDVGGICGFPAVVKPNREGSTIGLTVVSTPAEVPDAVELALKYDSTVLIERYVKGIEITVGVLGNDDIESLPIIEICPKSGLFDYEAKYTAGLTEKIIPARISQRQTLTAKRYAEEAHRALGCSGMSRVDMIVTDEDIYVLEVNTIPGMTPTSLLPKAAEAKGISFTEFISRVIDYGLELGAR